MAKKQSSARRKLIAFDQETFQALDLLARDSMKTWQELSDEAFGDLLKKYGRSDDLKTALKLSLKQSTGGKRRELSRFPPGSITRRLPPCSVTNSRPSGANSIAVALDSPLSYSSSTNPDGATTVNRDRRSKASTYRVRIECLPGAGR